MVLIDFAIKKLNGLISYDDSVLRCNEENLVEFIGDKPCKESLIRTSECIPMTTSLFYFEVDIVNCREDDCIVVGLSTNDADRCPGMNMNTIGIYGLDGSIYQDGEEVASANSFSKGDTISCKTIRIKDGSFLRTFCQFFKNGKKNGSLVYLYGIESKMVAIFRRELFPAVGVGTPGAVVWINLGEKAFRYQIGKLRC